MHLPPAPTSQSQNTYQTSQSQQWPANRKSELHSIIIFSRAKLTPPSVWTNRKQAASRTPQSRSHNASPAQQTNPTQKPAPPPSNVWAQRANHSQSQSRESSNGRPETATTQQQASTTPSNGFNAAEVRVFLERDVQAASAAYKVQETQGGAKNGGGAWGAGKRESWPSDR